MKSKNVLWFMLVAILSLAVLGYFFPSNGIKIGSTTLEFVHPYDVIRGDTSKKVDLNSVLTETDKYFNKDEIKNFTDSLKAFENFANNSPTRIHYPEGKRDMFFGLFELMENSKKSKKNIRIIHYGDSQIEVDRITDLFRENLQTEFSGNGPGIIPAIQTIPSLSVSQDYSGNLTRYTIYGSNVDRANHRRYGIIGLVCELNGNATINFRTREQAYPNAKQFSKVRLVVGKTSPDFKATLVAGGKNIGQKTIEKETSNASVITWLTDRPVKSGTITLSGIADIYAIALDGQYGVNVDNIPMRGCSGDIFSRIEFNSLSSIYDDIDTKLIILQFGGNAMPQINSKEKAIWFSEQIEKQIQHFQKIHPNCLILFIGPSDMSKNIKGSMKTWPYLIDVKEEIKKVVLKNGAAYWDMFEAMGGENSMPEWVKAKPALATTDYIHFTQLGAKKISEMLNNALMNDYQLYKVRQHYKNIKEGKVIGIKNIKKNDKKK